MMEKTNDEIKKGLECCIKSPFRCKNDCPYKEGCNGEQIMVDALALIQQLEAERDALMVYVRSECSACKYSDYSFTEKPCNSCFADHRSKWEWRGVQKEE